MNYTINNIILTVTIYFAEIFDLKNTQFSLRLPGLESSKQNKAQEDVFYNTMMCGLLQIVLRPILDEQKTPLLSSSSSLPLPPADATATEIASATAHDITTHGDRKASSSTRNSVVDLEQGDDCINEKMSVRLSRCGHSSDGWIVVRQGQPAPVPSSSGDDTEFKCDPSSEIKTNTWVNTLKWKAFTRKHRDKVLSSFYL